MSSIRQAAGADKTACDCNCGGGTPCNVLFFVKGCGNLGLDGATVSVSGGPSGTTSGGGFVTLDVGVAGSYSVTVSASRFVSNTATRTLTCGGEVDVTLSAAAGYHCATFCAYPLADTLHTDLAAPDDVMTFSGSQWQTPDLGGGVHTVILDDHGNVVFTVGVCGGLGTPTLCAFTCPPAFTAALCCPFAGPAVNLTE